MIIWTGYAYWRYCRVELWSIWVGELVWVTLTCIICSKLCTSIRVVKRQVLLSLKCIDTYDREKDKNLMELGFYPVRPWTLDVLGICFYLLGIWHYQIRIQLKCSLSFSCSCLMGKIFPPNYQTRPFLNLRKSPTLLLAWQKR